MSKRGETRLAVYEYIYKRISNGGTAPTVRDICAALKLKSTSTAHLHLENLRSEGYIAFDKNLQRTIRLTGKIPEGAKVKPAPKLQSGNTVTIPLIGKVAAGLPQYAFDDMQAQVAIDIGEDFGGCVLGEGAEEGELPVRREKLHRLGCIGGWNVSENFPYLLEVVLFGESEQFVG